MAMDRDLAVAFVRAWSARRSGPLVGWEMLAATGARGLRIVRETGAFRDFALTEANPTAFEVLAANARTVPGARAIASDAHRVPPGGPFDYVDLDPYGTPVPFVEVALASVRPSGVLAVTATDMPVLAGAQRASCEARYGARPIRGRLGPEGGLRILLAYLDRTSRTGERGIRPLLAYVRGHHLRAFVQVEAAPPRESPVGRIDPATWTGPPLGRVGPFGPLWIGPLFDPELVRTLASPPTAAEPGPTEKFLARLREEVDVDVPFYYEPNEIAASLSLSFPPSRERMFAGLREAGYRAARTHARPEGFRTDAPRTVVEEVARAASSPH